VTATGLLSRHPKFAVLLISRLVSRVGDVLYTLAATWSVLTTTHSIVGASMVALGSLLPNLFLALPLSALADRWSKKPLMVATDWCRAGIVGLVGFLMLHDPVQPWLLYGLTVSLSAGALLFSPASSAMIRLVVPEDRLTEANGLWQAVLSVLGVASFGV
jgi:MFS family permease